ncbi:hypothetical protein E7V67_026100 [[Empedobacter] haloabium]|uniref:Uncharacterized protein n=1 Tax=[Empedobacter] haloabium TaxID=592317 RepID=A0ABZ1UKD3_9BURK
MNTTTYTTPTRPATAPRSWIKVLAADLRDALERLGKPFVNGQYPFY